MQYCQLQPFGGWVCLCCRVATLFRKEESWLARLCAGADSPSPSISIEEAQARLLALRQQRREVRLGVGLPVRTDIAGRVSTPAPSPCPVSPTRPRPGTSVGKVHHSRPRCGPQTSAAPRPMPAQRPKSPRRPGRPRPPPHHPPPPSPPLPYTQTWLWLSCATTWLAPAGSGCCCVIWTRPGKGG